MGRFMNNVVAVLKDDVKSFREGWKFLPVEQKISLISMLFLLISLPLGILLSITPTKLFSRAGFPITSPISNYQTSTPRPSLTVTPQPTIPLYRNVLNSASGYSCDSLCQKQNMTCLSVGTNPIATNGYAWRSYRNSCAEISIACDAVMKKTAKKSCSGNAQPWTICRCQL